MSKDKAADKVSLENQIAQALHIEWAFKDTNSKPDKIIVQGYPKGGYHLSYREFTQRIAQLLTAERRKVLDEVKVFIEDEAGKSGRKKILDFLSSLATEEQS